MRRSTADFQSLKPGLQNFVLEFLNSDWVCTVRHRRANNQKAGARGAYRDCVSDTVWHVLISQLDREPESTGLCGLNSLIIADIEGVGVVSE